MCSRLVRSGSAMLDEIADMESILKAYINEAIKVEKAGLKVPMKKTTEFNMPEEFKNALKRTPCLEESILCTDTWTTTRIPSLLFCSQAIKNPGVED